MWLGQEILFLLAQMSQSSIYEVPVLNTDDDLDRCTAMTANLDIDADGLPIITRLSR
ncbi:MAG: hypothetical protein P8J17_05010 [Halioglobus sp.]|nr:hypothetical protein [Halioglobus sp.]